jgi:hypothetical protein
MARAALLLLLLLAAPACAAQTAVHHCVSSDGTPVFTDQPCDSAQSLRVGAAPAHPEHACPATRKALRERVAKAFARQDANALAGLMLWQGWTDIEAVREVARLKRRMRQPLLDVADAGPDAAGMTGASDAPATASTRPAILGPEPGLLVHLGGVQEASTPPLRFTVAVRAGCLWLRP